MGVARNQVKLQRGWRSGRGVERGMKTPHPEVLDRLESQFVRAFCIRAS